MDTTVKVYMAIHKTNGNVWCGRKTLYMKMGGLKAAMKTSFYGADKDDYNIYEYELKDGRIVE
jgi:hypothetical protein